MFQHLQSEQDQLSPVLCARECNALRHYGKVTRFKPAHVLYTEGNRHIPLFVILSTAIEVERDGLNEPYIHVKQTAWGIPLRNRYRVWKVQAGHRLLSKEPTAA